MRLEAIGGALTDCHLHYQRPYAVNLAEVFDRLIRRAGLSEAAVDTSVESLMAGGLSVAAADQAIGRLAGHLRARHYRKGRAEVSLADCVALATSMTLRAKLATSDRALAAATRKELVPILALPDSAGRRP